MPFSIFTEGNIFGRLEYDKLISSAKKHQLAVSKEKIDRHTALRSLLTRALEREEKIRALKGKNTF